ncbi:MAG: response regulator [Candidatus Paceibacterota bacterium]
MKVLLIDDDAFLRDMYATKFRELGHEVTVAENGAEALASLKENCPDVVLLDMVMPGMGGLEFLALAIEQVGKDATKFIVLSNQSDEVDKKKAEELGAVGYIVKAELIPSEVVSKVEALA